jgi:hypothetical protein
LLSEGVFTMKEMTATQEPLPLLLPSRREKGDDWHLDEHTREVGRRGLAEARAALAAAARRAEARESRAAA